MNSGLNVKIIKKLFDVAISVILIPIDLLKMLKNIWYIYVWGVSS